MNCQMTHAEAVSLLAEKQAALEKADARIRELEALSVTNIMIDVVPGHDGMGEEVYAKSVGNVEGEMSRLSQKIDELEIQLAQVSHVRELQALRLKSLEAQNSALAAIVKQQREAVEAADNYFLTDFDQGLVTKALALDTATAENVLNEYRREVVEECAKIVRDKICFKFATGSPSRDIAQAALEDIRALIAAPKENTNV